ncbi:uncharacterized protein LOC131008983 [Salvia miltiorrhiza]|uniref:uncharacterized protein LOC131008983 n=1 Tax=Salvia miltiorrhiza TaxID=226208 RepID=UPI0025ACB9F1|nr:uncharacterized protein LOC131008983 [Salvia miltiorrhiza]
MPGSRVELQLSTEHLENRRRVFKRLFVMLEPCKLNWLGGCRHIISLDGCHLKGVTFVCLLTAVGKDGNDGIVPIAWAVVNKENKNNWRWFLGWLKQEMMLDDGGDVSIMSDMQKGLMEAVKEVTPEAEHRWYARHIYANWSKKWKGEELKKSISDARHKPIISMLEDIRVIVMNRIKDRRCWVGGWKSDWCPNALKVFEANKQSSVDCNVLWNGDNAYEVSHADDKHIVFVDTRQCTCRAWDLHGIPCAHAIAACYSSKMEGLQK